MGSDLESTAMDFVRDQNDNGRKHFKKRRKTLYDYVIMAGSIAGAFAAVGCVAAWALDKLPVVKPSELAATNARVAVLEGGQSILQLNQLQTLELQYLDRIQKLADDIAKNPNSPDVFDKRHDQNEAQQRLESVRNRITAIQSRVKPQ